VDKHGKRVLTAFATPLRILARAVRCEVVRMATAAHPGCAIRQEADGVGQHQVQGFGEAVARHWHVCVLVELLDGLHGGLLEALLAGGRELAVEGIVPRDFRNGSCGLQGGRLGLYTSHDETPL
jgi:hypothetical protein